MGGNNVKGLYWMETIFPPEHGGSVIPPDKLEKEFQKGTIPRPKAKSGGDQDMDEYVDQCIEQVYQHYDPKGLGQLKKSTLKQFFKDSLDLYALRVGRKTGKDVVAQGVKFDQAMEASVAKVALSDPKGGNCSKKEFVDFLNCYDLDEALGSFLNIQEVTVNTSKVEFVDTSQFKSQADAPKKVQYRDRSNFQD